MSPEYFSSSPTIVLGLNFCCWPSADDGRDLLGGRLDLAGRAGGLGRHGLGLGLGRGGRRLGLLLRRGRHRGRGRGRRRLDERRRGRRGDRHGRRGGEEGHDQAVAAGVQGVEPGLLEVEDHPGDGPRAARLELGHADPLDRGPRVVDRPDVRLGGEERVEEVDDEARRVLQGEDLGDGGAVQGGLDGDRVTAGGGVDLAQADVALGRAVERGLGGAVDDVAGLAPLDGVELDDGPSGFVDDPGRDPFAQADEETEPVAAGLFDLDVADEPRSGGGEDRRGGRRGPGDVEGERPGGIGEVVGLRDGERPVGLQDQPRRERARLDLDLADVDGGGRALGLQGDEGERAQPGEYGRKDSLVHVTAPP